MNYTIAESFVGAGGSFLGFKKEGFKNILVNEMIPQFMDTLYSNNGEDLKDSLKYTMSISDLPFDEIKGKLHDKVDVLMGGVVCKGFSKAGMQAINDPRNYLYLDYLKLVESINPKVSIIENVPDLLNAKLIDKQFVSHEKCVLLDSLYKEFHQLKFNTKNPTIKDPILRKNRKDELYIQIKEIKDYLDTSGMLISFMEDLITRYNDLGYDVYHNILYSSWYGAYTHRKRLFIVAVKKGMPKFEFPNITHYHQDLKGKLTVPLNHPLQSVKTIKDALDSIDYSIEDPLNKIIQPTPKMKFIYEHIPQGQSYSHIKDSIPKENQVYSYGSDASHVRPKLDSPIPTITAHPSSYISPVEDRVLTIRENAVLQGFPVDYIFKGTKTQVLQQIGNSIPPQLANAMALQVKNYLNSYYKQKGLD